MTIERARAKVDKMTHTCVPLALDTALGDGRDGPHIPKHVYDVADGGGLAYRWVIEQIGGRIYDASLVSRWMDMLNLKRNGIERLKRYCPLANELTDKDIAVAREIQKMDNRVSCGRLYAALQLAARAAANNDLFLGVDLMGGNSHFKLSELSPSGGVLVFCAYNTDKYGWAYGGYDLVMPGQSSEENALSFLEWTRTIFFYPFSRRDFEIFSFVFFDLDPDSKKLEWGEP